MQASERTPEEELIEKISTFKHDPLGYVLFAFPWGEEGTPLAKEKGPRPWQTEHLTYIGEQLRKGALEPVDVIQTAVSSGHGVGKSADVAWIILWAMSTMVDTRGVVTANTENQLRTKTWPELAKWHRMAINSHWFKFTATALFSPEHEKTWRVDMIPWSAENVEAFAGLHNQGRRLFLLLDEASAIPPSIWETSEGAMTDENTEILWCVYGNPTRNSGRFFDCFNRLAHRWWNKRVDAREVPGTNKKQIQRWLEDYGEDSDFFRVRVRGLHPRASELQFIPSDLVFAAQRRPEPYSGLHDPLIMGIDLARGGSDCTVIWYRRGLDARSLSSIVIPGFESRDTSRTVAKIADLATTTDRTMRPDAINVDGTGIGGALIDRLRQLGLPVHEVNFSWSANDRRYANFRAECWAKLREALKHGLAIPADDSDLERDLTSVEYEHNKRDQLLLESKDDLKSRVGVSPDRADALALTFAFNIEQRELTEVLTPGLTNQALTDYDPFTRH